MINKTGTWTSNNAVRGIFNDIYASHIDVVHQTQTISEHYASINSNWYYPNAWVNYSSGQKKKYAGYAIHITLDNENWQFDSFPGSFLTNLNKVIDNLSINKVHAALKYLKQNYTNYSIYPCNFNENDSSDISNLIAGIPYNDSNMSHYNVDESELYDSNNNIKTDPIFIHKIELDNLVVKKVYNSRDEYFFDMSYVRDWSGSSANQKNQHKDLVNFITTKSIVIFQTLIIGTLVQILQMKHHLNIIMEIHLVKIF